MRGPEWPPFVLLSGRLNRTLDARPVGAYGMGTDYPQQRQLPQIPPRRPDGTKRRSRPGADGPWRQRALNPIMIIPARMAASRLPGKPLADIGGAPMIQRVIERARLSGRGAIAVAAAEPEIVAAAEAAGVRAVLTDPDLPSGTDRIHAALPTLDPEGRHDVIVNLQGDMPTFDPALLGAVLDVLEAMPQADIATLVSPSDDAGERADPNVVKAVLCGAGASSPARCLYFTRAAAPSGEGPVMRHVGLYAYRRQALDRFVAAAPSPLELREKLEQLRALELGMEIGAGIVDGFPKGVDTPEHLEAARQWYRTAGQRTS